MEYHVGPELFILWSTMWALNYLFYGVPLGPELFILWSTMWALNYLFYGVPLGPELFILWSTMWALNYLFYGVPLGRVRILVGEGLESRGGHQVAVLHHGGDLSEPGHTYQSIHLYIFFNTNMNFIMASNLDTRFFARD